MSSVHWPFPSAAQTNGGGVLREYDANDLQRILTTAIEFIPMVEGGVRFERFVAPADLLSENRFHFAMLYTSGGRN
jgi:hypothetical protein